MLRPSLFGENLLDEFFDFPSFSRIGNSQQGMMHTDVCEKENAYEISMNLPGFKKEDVKGEVKDGYLTISASTDTSNENKDEQGRFIRKERYTGSCSRSFYIGEHVSKEDIKAKFEDGVLKIEIPKTDPSKEVEERKYIAIEG